MENLLAYLGKLLGGEISDTSELETLLAECWGQLSGDPHGMTGSKLCNRMEDVSWESPILSFVIERHGGTVMGSSRAELQDWAVNVEQKTISLQYEGYRQISPRQAPVDVNLIADKLVSLIVNGHQGELLQWSTDERVRILSGKIFPDNSAKKQTLEGRKKRLVKAMEGRLFPLGWVRNGSWWEKK